ncbi:MAG: MbcA/ParS/Xre antitoxin family protein [Methylophilus sp.]|jgi:uncharacterized protein (DUF2384 family)|nr:MbcA/ParS/Xre antitoxin family protein [Methylophilus sp.]
MNSLAWTIVMPSEFESTIQFKKLRALALETFGSESKADQWLNTFHTSLSGTPLSVAETSTGMIEVKKILSAIRYGGVA